MTKTITLEPNYIAIARELARHKGDTLSKELTESQAIAYINKVLAK